MLNFNKDHVSAKMAENNPGLSKVKALEQLDAVLVAMMDTLSDGKDAKPNKKGIRAKLTMVGFGTFMLKSLPERTHRNPQTGVDVVKKAHNDVKYKEGSYFKDAVN